MFGHPIADRPILTNSAWSYLRRPDFLMSSQPRVLGLLNVVTPTSITKWASLSVSKELTEDFIPLINNLAVGEMSRQVMMISCARTVEVR